MSRDRRSFASAVATLAVPIGNAAAAPITPTSLRTSAGPPPTATGPGGNAWLPCAKPGYNADHQS
jgi:hypothetical protein